MDSDANDVKRALVEAIQANAIEASSAASKGIGSAALQHAQAARELAVTHRLLSGQGVSLDPADYKIASI
jgi:hypothetical protein